jgi:membrane fusion protein (multidrug efflux system)
MPASRPDSDHTEPACDGGRRCPRPATAGRVVWPVVLVLAVLTLAGLALACAWGLGGGGGLLAAVRLGVGHRGDGQGGLAGPVEHAMSEGAVTVVALRPELPTATTVRVEPRAWKATVRAQGGLVADELTVIGARVAGRIAEVAVEVGQRVAAGDVLVRLDDTELRLRVVQAQAQLGRVRAAIGLDPVAETIAGTGSTSDADAVEVSAAPEVVRERARLDEARAQLARLQALADRNAVSRSDLDAGVAAVAVAEATLAAAVQQVEEKVALVKVHRAQLALTRETWEQAVVRAPFEGLVQSRHGSAAGASVQVGDPLVTLVRTDPLRFRGTVPERLALQLREGQTVTVRLDGVAEPIRTRVARIAPVLDEMSRTLLFEADIPNPEGLLRSGLFAQADVVVDAEAEALVVPTSSVLEFAGTEKVWLLGPGGEPRGVPVRTGRRSKGLVEIVSGLSSGDFVVQHADTAAGLAGGGSP